MTEGPVGAKAPVGLGELESVMARAASPMGRFERYLPLWMALYVPSGPTLGHLMLGLLSILATIEYAWATGTQIPNPTNF